MENYFVDMSTRQDRSSVLGQTLLYPIFASATARPVLFDCLNAKLVASGSKITLEGREVLNRIYLFKYLKVRCLNF